mmetsp:Transcript_1995/g.3522  ORF Transcript_1995/g.3522 Transcript_1995/m.3522 type:complete len:281 (+) Transcript_1995:664-1506(+)
MAHRQLRTRQLGRNRQHQPPDRFPEFRRPLLGAVDGGAEVHGGVRHPAAEQPPHRPDQRGLHLQRVPQNNQRAPGVPESGLRAVAVQALLQAGRQPVRAVHGRADEEPLEADHEDLQQVRDHLQHLLQALPNHRCAPARADLLQDQVQQRVVRRRAQAAHREALPDAALQRERARRLGQAAADRALPAERERDAGVQQEVQEDHQVRPHPQEEQRERDPQDLRDHAAQEDAEEPRALEPAPRPLHQADHRHPGQQAQPEPPRRLLPGRLRPALQFLPEPE